MVQERRLNPRSVAPITHVEIRVGDAARARAFYGAVFGWRFTRVTPDYEWIETGAAITAGLLEKGRDAPEPTALPGVTVFVAVRDVDACVAAVLAAGGGVVRSARDVTGHGRYAVIADPEGNPLGVWSRPA